MNAVASATRTTDRGNGSILRVEAASSAAPRGVGGQAADHPGRDAERDAPVAGAVGAFMRDVVVEVGVDLVDPTSGDRQRAGSACRAAPSAPPARPCAPASCGLRGDAWGASGGRSAWSARACSATRAPCPVSSYSRRRGRPSAAAASSQREASRPNSSSRPSALYSVPWPVSARDPRLLAHGLGEAESVERGLPRTEHRQRHPRISVSSGSRVPGLRRDIRSE